LTDSEAFAYSITEAKGLMKFYIDVLFVSMENGGLLWLKDLLNVDRH
jgi:hypothetical protein